MVRRQPTRLAGGGLLPFGEYISLTRRAWPQSHVTFRRWWPHRVVAVLVPIGQKGLPGRPLHGNRRREEIDMFLHRVALVTLLLPTLALANGYNVPNVNPRDLARVDSARAAQDTAAAVYGNPAALAGIQGVNLSLGVSLLDLRSDWHAPDGFTPLPLAASSPRDASLKFKPVPPPALFASYGTGLNFSEASRGELAASGSGVKPSGACQS